MITNIVESRFLVQKNKLRKELSETQISYRLVA